MVFGDMHCDLPYKVYKTEETLDSELYDWSLKDIKASDSFIQVFATCVEDDKDLNSFTGALNVINTFTDELEKFGYKISVNGFDDTKLNAVLSLEGGAPLEGKITNLKAFYDLGVRIVTLTWNYENELGFGALTSSSRGLKPFGKAVIKEMNRFKMVTDVSHLNEGGFWDAVEISDLPVIASHSNSKNLCDNPRNITDEQFNAIKKQKGLVGINSYPFFLNNTKCADIKDVINHIEHFLSLGGEDNLCFGFDYDGIGFYTCNLNHISGYHLIINELMKLNYTDELIAKICYKNMKNYFNSYIFEIF